MHHTSRGWQNILHISGVLNSVLMILGATLIGGQNYVTGISVMIIGGVILRISSEAEFQKQQVLLSEKFHENNRRIEEEKG